MLLMIPALFGQGGGVITGRVLDQTGARIPGVSVEALPGGSAEHIGTLTGEDGTFRFENLPPGPAELTFKLINFATVRRDIVVPAAGSLTVDVLLVVATSADITITEQIGRAHV